MKTVTPLTELEVSQLLPKRWRLAKSFSTRSGMLFDLQIAVTRPIENGVGDWGCNLMIHLGSKCLFVSVWRGAK